MVTDQHPESLGGVQVALRLQRRHLERLGHRVTIAAPALHRPGYVKQAADREAYLDLPSRPITADREYGVAWPGADTDRAIAVGLARRPAVDLVHVQGDFWGALIGLRAARGLSRARVRRGLPPVPVVLTLHNNVDAGTRAVVPWGPLADAAFLGLRGWRALAAWGPGGSSAASGSGASGSSEGPHPTGAWRYLAELAAQSAAVTAPSAHFARALERNGVAEQVTVTRGGVDDKAIAAARAVPRAPRERPRFVWLGRMSHEKRVLEFIDALAESNIDADVVMHGAGLLLPRVRQRIGDLGLADRVTLAGSVSYEQALASIRDADALVQTSVGFETQGLTPFEAAALGTPTIFCDPNIADDVAASVSWRVGEPTVAALAETLRTAAGELAEGLEPGGVSGASTLRVPEAEGEAFLQSRQTGVMLEVYERVLREARSAI